MRAQLSHLNIKASKIPMNSLIAAFGISETKELIVHCGFGMKAVCLA